MLQTKQATLNSRIVKNVLNALIEGIHKFINALKHNFINAIYKLINALFLNIIVLNCLYVYEPSVSLSLCIIRFNKVQV